MRRYAPGTGEITLDTPLSEAPRALYPDTQGGVWIAARRHLMRVDGGGTERLQLEPFAGNGSSIKALVVEPREGSVWVASRGAVRAVEMSGELEPLLALDADHPRRDIRALAVYTDRVPPTVAITVPAQAASSRPVNRCFKCAMRTAGAGSMRAPCNGRPTETRWR
ncbi:MAG: hypothetical protein ACREXX_06490 [Gammaproteobacteria bacterium]